MRICLDVLLSKTPPRCYACATRSRRERGLTRQTLRANTRNHMTMHSSSQMDPSTLPRLLLPPRRRKLSNRAFATSCIAAAAVHVTLAEIKTLLPNVWLIQGLIFKVRWLLPRCERADDVSFSLLMRAESPSVIHAAMLCVPFAIWGIT